MAKFTVSDPNDDEAPVRPAMDEVKAINAAPPVALPTAPPPVQPRPTPSTVPVMAIGDQSSSQIASSNEVPAEPKKEEHWMKAYWRPAMGWLYMLICFCDFVAFPAIAMFMPVIMKGFGILIPYTAWQSLSLSNGGLMHLAFGAILGVSAWTRGQEKIAKIN